MKKPILMDGAVGTTLWQMAEKRGIEKVPVWRYNVEQPEMVKELHKEYIEAGAQMILVNSFGANEETVARYSSLSPDKVIQAGTRLAVEAARGTGAKVSLSIGPLSQMMEPWGDLTPEEVQRVLGRQIRAGMEEGPDSILIQTFIDLDMMKAAVDVALPFGVPVFCAMTFTPVGKTIMGNSVEDMMEALTPMGIAGIGMNCSLGPAESLPVLRRIAENTSLPILFKPNAGKPISAPDGTSAAEYTPEDFVREIAPALDLADYIGGCCGSNVAYIRLLKEEMDKREP